jgi:Cu-Zn family superoxide dismutase
MTGCDEEEMKGHGAALKAKAELIDTKGKSIGTATFTQQHGSVKIELDLEGLPPGEHGCHVHGAGKCDGPDFKTASAHFNPEGKKHGLKNPEGPHAGDMPNVTADKDGKVKTTLEAKLISLKAGEKNCILTADGTSIVVHAKPDDHKTDPAGDAGPRIACGVIKAVK